MTLTILDYGGGNIKSVLNLLDSVGEAYQVTNKPNEILNAEKLIFPGQGHFGQVMNALNEKNLSEPLLETIAKGTPFLGICVGLQVLFDSSEEAPDVKGLGVFKGKNIRFTAGKIPQIGWNRIQTTSANSYLADDYFYFVNSFHVVPENKAIVSAYSDYHTEFTAAVQWKNVTACQFHPEKSGLAGRNAIHRWIKES